ncbi:MAG TPA: TadE/TadG family type IV pilus assembly protein [Xanthobacteraceae bacterium]|nr:TadE/TadG family type IV pilus assembly protein [Xanthobacteraceae bacterium]
MGTLLSKIGRRFLPIAKRFDKNEKASAAVEFGLVAIPFFGLLFAIIETALVFFAGQVLETAVGDAGRLILTGQAQSQNFQLTDFKNQICTNAVQTLFTCQNIAVDVRAATSFSSADLSMPLNATTHMLDTTNFAYNTTQPCDIVVVRVVYEWPTFVRGLGLDLASAASSTHKHILMSTAAFRNEPYGGSWC